MVEILGDSRSGRKTPWHLWAVGVIAILFNAVGVYDYVMSKTQGAAYLTGAGFTPAQVAHYEAMPIWMTAVWAIGVFGAFAASVLLLLKNRLAAPVFIVSLSAFLISLVYHYGIAGAADVLGTSGLISSAVIAVMLMLFIIYARAMGKGGVLR